MIKRIVHIESPSALHSKNRQLEIKNLDTEITATPVPFEDIGVIVVVHPLTTLTSAVYDACAYYGIAVIHCGANYQPCSYTLPIEGHSRASYYLREQLNMQVPTRKQLWRVIIREKIAAQAALLKLVGSSESTTLLTLSESVRSGDVSNIEWVAASKYFPALFHEDFVRERWEWTLWANAWMNYGYAVVRAAVARAIVASGLHPSIGIFHSNGYNYFNLADDLIEPLRPMVDRVVHGMFVVSGGMVELTPKMKVVLISILSSELEFGNGRYGITHLLDLYATAFRNWMANSDDFRVPEVAKFILKRWPAVFNQSDLWE